MHFKRAMTLFVLGLFMIFFLSAPLYAAQSEIKIGTVSLLAVVTKSQAGLEAKKLIETKALELQKKYQGDQMELNKMRDEIEKKSSVWSMEVRSNKDRDYQKKLRELQLKSEDARFELQQLDNKLMGPLRKDLHEIIAEVGRREGFTIILEKTKIGINSQTGLLFADESIDVSDLILQELNARAGGAK